MRLLASLVVALAPVGVPPTSYHFEIAGDQQFSDTKLDVKAGEMLRFTATGKLQMLAPLRAVGPAGMSRGWLDGIKSFPVLDGARYELIGRVGARETSRAFLIGAASRQRVAVGGRLYLGINMPPGERIDGILQVEVERTPAPKGGGETEFTAISQAQLDSVPTRVSDTAGNPGDRINFLLIGSEAQVRKALEQSGWTKVDRNKNQAVVDGLVSGFSKDGHASMPMSSLRLYGRVQDYGYVQGERLKILSERHHFRLWKAPFTVGGRAVWVGAGTHDTGLDRDSRNFGLAHKIDPDTDKEREFIGGSIAESGTVGRTVYMTATRAVRAGRTVTGAEFQSDGRTMIIYLVNGGSAGAGGERELQ